MKLLRCLWSWIADLPGIVRDLRQMRLEGWYNAGADDEWAEALTKEQAEKAR